MKKKLFQEVFKKAKNQSGKNSKHGLSTYLERVLSDEFKFPISKITFVRYYEKYIDDEGSGSYNPSTDLLDKMCEYLGYVNYEDFIAKNDSKVERTYVEKGNIEVEEQENESAFLSYLKKHKITLMIAGGLILVFVIFQSITKQKWMIWQEDKYIEVSFDVEKYNIGKLELYNEDRIQNFRKVTPNCNTKFFKESGEANLWYGINNGGDWNILTSWENILKQERP